MVKSERISNSWQSKSYAIRGRLTIVLCSILLFCVYFALTSFAAAQTIDKPQKLSPKKLTGLVNGYTQKVFYGGVVVPAGDTISGSIVVIDGTLDMQNDGVLSGDAWVVNGSLILNGSARVLGRVNLVNSHEFLSSQAEVKGGVYYYVCECQFDDEQFEQKGKLVFKKHEDPRTIKTKFKYSLGYTVEVGLVRQNPLYKKPHVRGHALLQIPLRMKKKGLLGFDMDFAVPFKGNQVDLVVRGFKKTYTNDYWQISRGESDWILLLTGNEYINYYERRGGELGLQIRLSQYLSLETTVSFQRDVSMPTESQLSLFYPHRRLPNNPSIDEGQRLAVSTGLTFDSRQDSAKPQNAWFFSTWVEKGIANGLGDFSYAGFSVDLRRYTRLPLGVQWDVRAKVFSTFDPIPRQITQSLNGYGGVRGLKDDPFTVHRGDRLALLSSEVRTALPDLPVFRWLFTRWDMLLFSDVGLLARAKNEKSPLGFMDTPFHQWKKSIGVGISGESFLPYVGIYLAQDINREQRNPRIIVRMMRSF